ncbi:MAG: helix-turn-helix transcriptional regulator [Propionibacteriales bacterium]|nr:helix-turn-helix transcriptional regulator [Propionibacteriales bacterium]
MPTSSVTDGRLEEFATALRTTGSSATARVDILTGAAAVQQCLHRLTASCDIESMSMQPRFSIEPTRARRPHPRGVTVRTLIKPDFATPQVIEHLAATEVRTSPLVSRLMVIVNRACALVDIRRPEDAEPVAAHITDTTLVASMVDTYEDIWSAATLLVEPEEQASFTSRQLLILTMLTDGATDEQIARRLELSSRSVRTEVAVIRETLHADSRFQAGVRYAELRGMGLVRQEG